MAVTLSTWIVSILGLLIMGLLFAFQVIAVIRPKAKWTMGRETLHMKTDWAAYEGIEVTGKIEKVFSRGELIVSGDECLAEKGRGRYVHRKLSESLRSAG